MIHCHKNSFLNFILAALVDRAHSQTDYTDLFIAMRQLSVQHISHKILLSADCPRILDIWYTLNQL